MTFTNSILNLLNTQKPNFYSIEKLLDKINLNGKVVLDIASGLGYYTRLAAKRGAKVVISVDFVEEQLETSKKISEQLGVFSEIKYLAKDAKEPELYHEGGCEVALGIHLLCYAANHSELERMTKVRLQIHGAIYRRDSFVMML